MGHSNTISIVCVFPAAESEEGRREKKKRMVGYRIHDRMQYMGGISILGNDLTPVCHAVDFVLFFFFTPTANLGFIFFF